MTSKSSSTYASIVYSLKIITNITGPSFDHFPNEVFQMFPNCHTFTIRSQIKELSPGDFTSKQLTTIDLSGNHLTRLRPGPLQILNVHDLHLLNNEISEIDDFAFRGTRAIRVLTLSGNKLTEIKRNTFRGLYGLWKLFLNDNEIGNIDDEAFADLSSLTHLSLNGNKIRFLNANTFAGPKHIRHFSANENDIESIAGSLYTLKNIETINLANNPIGDLKLVNFSKLWSLKELNLENTGTSLKIESDETDPNQSSSLMDLNLARNNLSDVVDLKALKMFPLLTYLNLSGNPFTAIDLTTNRIDDDLPLLTIIGFECERKGNGAIDSRIEIVSQRAKGQCTNLGDFTF